MSDEMINLSGFPYCALYFGAKNCTLRAKPFFSAKMSKSCKIKKFIICYIINNEIF